MTNKLKKALPPPELGGRNATLRDVAVRAGVSTATASYALNFTRPVGREAREKVEQAARELGYRPNIIARHLKTGRSRLICCLVGNLSNPFIAAAVEGANRVVTRAGYGLLIYRAAPDAEDVSRGVEFASSYRAAGLIVAHPDATESIALRDWIAGGEPLVQAIHTDANLQVDRVFMAEEAAAYQATRLLLEAGHRDIAILSRPLRMGVYASVTAGYERALVEWGLVTNPKRIRSKERSGKPSAERDLGYRETLSLIHGKRRPTALLCAHNQIAVGALQALRDSELDVPSDMSLITFDEVEWLGITDPAITSIGIHGEHLGEAAAHVLLRRMAEPSMTPETVSLQLKLIERASVGPPPKRAKYNAASHTR